MMQCNIEAVNSRRMPRSGSGPRSRLRGKNRGKFSLLQGSTEIPVFNQLLGSVSGFGKPGIIRFKNRVPNGLTGKKPGSLWRRIDFYSVRSRNVKGSAPELRRGDAA
jgi:hypothetical protein